MLLTESPKISSTIDDSWSYYQIRQSVLGGGLHNMNSELSLAPTLSFNKNRLIKKVVHECKLFREVPFAEKTFTEA